MVRIYEYQGKQLLSSVGISIPDGAVASTPEEARKVAKNLGKPVAVKAQIWATGRLKAGGIRFVSTPEEAEVVAKEILGVKIRGLQVKKVLIEKKLEVDKEFYLSVIVNDSYKVKGPVVMFSTKGGVDIEEVAARTPEKIASLTVDYLAGIQPSDARELVSKLEVDPNLIDPISNVVCGLYQVFKQYDARVAEINPLVSTKDGRVFGADCRITIDDNSVYRHPEFGVKLPRDMEREPTELEEMAWKIEAGDYRGTGYFTQMVPEIEGEDYIGFHGIGGGGSMLGASALIMRGLKIANYADTSGDPPASKVYRVIKTILSQPVNGYILMGACLANQEQWHHAHGIVRALREELKDKHGFPVLLLIAGNKEKETHEIIKNGLKDLPIRWELYGREYIYKTDFIADRMKAMVDVYLKEKRG